MESRIYLCDVYHSRLNPVKHTFSYNVYYYVLDLDELENGKLDNSLFGYNKSRVISIKTSDYMTKDTNKSIKEKVIEKLRNYQNQIIQESNTENNEQFKQTKFYNENIIKLNIESIKKIKLITNPRYFNYSFNPVNFYYCYDNDNELVQIVVEINNTFGETHLYYPSPTEFRDSKLKYPFKNSVNNNPYLKRYSSSKDFHVSPFNSLDGAYDFYFSDINDQACFDIRINLMSKLNDYSLETLHTDGSNGLYDYIILTRLWSTKKPLTLSVYDISKLLFNYPIATFLTIPRVLYQAGVLHWGKKLKIYSKPNPPLENTTVLIEPSNNELSAMNFFLDYLKQFNNISITLNLPNDQIISIDNRSDLTNPQETVQVKVLNYEFFWKLFLNNKSSSSLSSSCLRGFSSKAIGMGYMCDDFQCNDLPGLLNQLCDLTISNSNIHSIISSGEDRKKIWNDLSEFINIENIFSLFLFNQENQIQSPYNWFTSSNSGYNKIIEEMDIKKNDRQMILEIEPSIGNGYSFGNYLIENDYLIEDCVNEGNNRLTVLIKSKESYDNYINYLSSKSSITTTSTVVNMDFKSFSNLNENKNKFDKIVSINSISSDNCNSNNNDLTLFKSLLKPNQSSRLFIQNINFNGSNGNASDEKPIRSTSFKNSYYKMIDEVGKKYWAVMANFQHNPFYLESRYMDLMKMLNKSSFINGHIYDDNDDDICYDIDNVSSPSFINIKNETLDNKTMVLNTIKNWIQQCKDNQKLFSIKIQENAMRQGCLLKMNPVEINEIYRATLFHLSYLYASFNNSIWSISKNIYTIKK